MRKEVGFAAGLLMLTGCQKAYEGVYLFEFGAVVAGDGESDCSENFDDLDCPEDGTVPTDDEWTFENEVDESPGLAFVQVVTGPKGEAYAIVGNQIYVGTHAGKAWTFAWDNREDNTETTEHETGYRYQEHRVSSQLTSLNLTLKGSVATGTLEVEQSSDVTYTESDEWDAADVGFGSGVIDTSGLEGDFVFNESDNQECGDSSCMVQYSSSMSWSREANGKRTGYEEDAFDGISGAYQEEGTNF